jgi:hypothetical protein
MDLFSGRPNPRWELSEEDSAELRRLIADLKPTDARAVAPPGLGYRGILIQETSTTMRAYRGYVHTLDRVREDPGRSTEAFVLERVPDQFRDLARIAATDLNTP